MRRLLIFPLMVLLFVACNPPSSLEDPNQNYFIKFYGRDGDQVGRDLVVLPDGNLILFGTSRHTIAVRGTQWYLVKVDPKGNVLWEKEFGGTLNEDARDIELTLAGNLVLVGNSNKTSTDRDILIMTMTTDGVIIDSARHAVRDRLTFLDSSGDEDVTSVTETTDGAGASTGFLIGGSTTYVYPGKPSGTAVDLRDALNFRVGTDLTVYPNTWNQSFGYIADDVSSKILQNPDPLSANKFFVFGYTDNNPENPTAAPNYNYQVYPLGNSGDAVDETIYGRALSGNEVLSSFSQAPPQSPFDGFFLGGLTQSGSATSDLYVVKFQEQLTFDAVTREDILFEKPLSINLGSNLPDVSAVQATGDGGLLVLGNENGFNNNQNWVLTKINSDGSLALTIPIVFGGDGLDICGTIKELPDGRILIIGTMRTGKPDVGELKLTLVKVSANGKFEN